MFQMQLAIRQDDTVAAAEQAVRESGPVPGGSEAGYVYASAACIEQNGLSVADELVDSLSEPWVVVLWGLVRGKDRWWHRDWSAAAQDLRVIAPLADAALPVYGSLFLGLPEDTIVLRAVDRLAAVAGSVAEPAPTPDERAHATAWVALWRLGHGDVRGVDEARRYLTQIDRPWRFEGWVRLIDAMRIKLEGGDPRAALLGLDSLVRELPLPLESEPLPAEVQNLVLARMLREVGEPERALAAVRRRFYTVWSCFLHDALPEYLREEGRLAAMVGDTTDAIKAYNHYLALREDPDPPWRAPWDSVRVELAALVAR